MAERERYVEANAAALRELLPADLVFANHVLMGGPVGAASGARYAVKAHGSELEYSMRGRPSSPRGGGRRSPPPTPSSSARPHPRRARGRRRPRRARATRCRPASTSTRSGRSRATRRSPALLDEARRDPPNPGNREERLPDEGNAERLAAFFAGDEPTVVYFGKLIYNKGVHVLFEALREARRPRADRRLRRLPRRAGGHSAAAARSSPGRSSTAISSTCCRSATSPSCPRSSPRRSGWSPPRPRPPAARRSSRGTRASPRSPTAWRRSTRERCATSPRSTPATPPTSPRSCGRLLALPEDERARPASRRPPRRRAPLELGQRRGSPPRTHKVSPWAKSSD